MEFLVKLVENSVRMNFTDPESRSLHLDNGVEDSPGQFRKPAGIQWRRLRTFF